MLVSRLTSRRSDNDAFYRGNRYSPWNGVAFGLIGASIAGITFVSASYTPLTLANSVRSSKYVAAVTGEKKLVRK